jgi:signal transduction histidine kinase
MNESNQSVIRTGGDADIAFAVVVLASFFATFSSLVTVSPLKIVLLIAMGTAYLAIGIYGYGYCARTNSAGLSLLYFAIQFPLGGLIVFLGNGAGFNALVLMPLAGHAVVLLPRNIGYLAQFAITFSYVAAVFAFSGSLQTVWQGLPTFAAGVVFIVVFTQMALNEESSRREVERLVSQLTDANQKLRDYALQIEDLATAKERNRLAREIHDGLGHYLTTIHMQIQAARAVGKNEHERADDILAKAQNLSQEALTDVRQSVAALRSPMDGHKTLGELIEGLLEGARNVGIEPVLVQTGDERMLNPQTRWTLYRAAQEGISNACKHAQAAHLWIKLDFTQPDCVNLGVEDDGIGPGDYKEGFGLMGLKERVTSVGGDVNIRPSSSGGFAFDIRVPA